MQAFHPPAEKESVVKADIEMGDIAVVGGGERNSSAERLFGAENHAEAVPPSVSSINILSNGSVRKGTITVNVGGRRAKLSCEMVSILQITWHKKVLLLLQISISITRLNLRIVYIFSS